MDMDLGKHITNNNTSICCLKNNQTTVSNSDKNCYKTSKTY